MKKIYVSLFIVCAAAAFTYCSSSKKSSSASTASSAATRPAPKKINYADNVAPIVAANCAPCHFPDKGGNKRALDTYAGVSGQSDEIIRRIQLQPNERGFMPRQHARLSDSAINVIKQWKAEGMADK